MMENRKMGGREKGREGERERERGLNTHVYMYIAKYSLNF